MRPIYFGRTFQIMLTVLLLSFVPESNYSIKFFKASLLIPPDHHSFYVLGGMFLTLLFILINNLFTRLLPPQDLPKEHDVTFGLVEQLNNLILTNTSLQELLQVINTWAQQHLRIEKIIFLLNENHLLKEIYPTATSSALRLKEDDPILGEFDKGSATRWIDIKQASGSNISPPSDKGKIKITAGMALAFPVRFNACTEGLLLLAQEKKNHSISARTPKTMQLICKLIGIALVRKKQEAHIAEICKYQDSLLENIPCGIITIDTRRAIMAANREALRILGRNGSDLLGKKISELPDSLARPIETLFTSSTNLFDYKTTLHRGENEDMPLRLNGTLLYNVKKEIAGALAIIVDQTSLNDLEQCIRRTDRLAALGTLAAGVAHEIKNPLVTLKTFVQLLPERYDDEEFRFAFSSLLGQEIKRIDSLVNQLLGFARPSKPKFLPIYIHQIVDNTLKLLQQPLLQKNIQVIKQYEAPVDLIRADADSLMQAFFNLFLNAIDAMENGGQLIIVSKLIDRPTNISTTSQSPKQNAPLFSISFKDTGRGISKKDLTHIFNPFFTTKANGTGLGLTIVHKIVQEHNGYIDVESIEGCGATFQLYFPIMISEVPA